MALTLTAHEPIPQPDNSLGCSGTGCTGTRFSPRAFEDHVSGRAPTLSLNGVLISGYDDRSWDPPEGKNMSERINKEISESERKRLTEGYYAEQRRQKAQTAEGVGTDVF